MALRLALLFLAGCGPLSIATCRANSSPGVDVSAWVDASLSPVDANQRQGDLSSLSAVYPVMYRVGLDGSLVRIASYGVDALLVHPRPAGFKVHVTVQNLANGVFDKELMRAVLADPVKRDHLISQLTSLVMDKHVDGINLDIENLENQDREAFTAFVRDLRTRMGSLGSLSVCVAARTSAPPTWQGASFVDWAAVGQLADEVHVMAYDWSYAGSPPGPTTPESWLESVVDYSVSQVPAAKLRIGLPLYGFVWGGQGGRPVPIRNAGDYAGWEVATTPPIVRGERPGPIVHRVHGTSQLYIDDTQSLRSKMAIVQSRGVTQVALWHLGQVDPGWVGSQLSGAGL